MDGERLQKYLARCGVASRREAEEYIAKGLVSVNGKVVTEMGTRVRAGSDVVMVNGKSVKPESEMVYIALNKPAGVVTTVTDPQGRKTVMSFVKQVQERIYPVGRLDSDTQGLLLLTNDGRVAHALTHPSHLVDKTYLAEVHGRVSRQDLAALAKGVELSDGLTAPAKARLVASSGPFCLIELTIREGRNRQVRRMCEAIGHPVRALVRTKFGPIRLGSLGEGKWRRLTSDEVEQLVALADSCEKTGR